MLTLETEEQCLLWPSAVWIRTEFLLVFPEHLATMVYQQNNRTFTIYSVHMLIAAFLNNTAKNHFIKHLMRGKI